MDQSNAASDGDIRTTAVQVALAACNKPNADPIDLIDVARDIYLFLIRKDPLIDVVHDCCDDKVIQMDDYERDEDGRVHFIGQFDE